MGMKINKSLQGKAICKTKWDERTLRERKDRVVCAMGED